MSTFAFYFNMGIAAMLAYQGSYALALVNVLMAIVQIPFMK